MDQRLVIIGGEEEPAALRVLEVLQHDVEQGRGEGQLVGAQAHLLQLQHRVGEIDVVVQIGIQMRAAVLVGGQQPAVAPERARMKSSARVADSARSARASARAAMARPRIMSAFHEVRILSSRAGRDARVAQREQLAARRSRAAHASCCGVLSEALRRPPRWPRTACRCQRPSKFGGAVEPEARARTARTPPPSARARTSSRPRRRTCPRGLRSRHRGSSRSRLPAPASRAAPSPRSPRRRARRTRSPVASAASRVHRQQRAVVVQHLLEVRNHPVLVHRVAAEAAAELIVDAAFAHALQSQGRHVQRLQVRLALRRRWHASRAAAVRASSDAETSARRRSRRSRGSKRSRQPCSRGRASGASREFDVGRRRRRHSGRRTPPSAPSFCCAQLRRRARGSTRATRSSRSRERRQAEARPRAGSRCRRRTAAGRRASGTWSAASRRRAA